MGDIIPTALRDQFAEHVDMLASGMASAEDARKALAFAALLKRRASEMAAQIKDAAIGWINVNGELVDGHTRYYVGTESKTKCINKVAAFNALIDACGGDIEQVAGMFLASDAIKPGAAKKALSAEQFAELFEVTKDSTLKTKLLTARVDGEELTEATE
jgi:hypothetical protein